MSQPSESNGNGESVSASFVRFDQFALKGRVTEPLLSGSSSRNLACFFILFFYDVLFCSVFFSSLLTYV